jgi:tRNA 5-methylaminomethyl-2-thiouridine biosynthesis bifunctional protein
MTPHPRGLAAPTLRWADGIPTDEASGDIYFNRQDPLGESRTVFLTGNDLPARLGTHGAPVHRVGETGFGTGLNFLLLWEAWRRAGALRTLSYVSFEQAPLNHADRQRFLASLRARGALELAALGETLDAALPEPLAGWHLIPLEGGRLRLHLYLGDAQTGLEDWLAQREAPAVDAWFLDGFAPKVGPALWQPEFLLLLARASAPGATLGTFTVARSVREGLANAGFEPQKVPGPQSAGGEPQKREVLVARLAQGLGRRPAPPPSLVTIAGAGLAGTAVALALAEHGVSSQVLEAETAPGGGASANPWALLHPRLPIDEGPRGPFLWMAYRLALKRVQGQAGFVPAPLRQYGELRRPERLGKTAARYPMLAPRLTLREDAQGPYLALAESGHAHLPQLLEALWPSSATLLGGVALGALEGTGQGWRLLDPTGKARAEGGLEAPLVLAAGASLKSLLNLPTGIVGGQLDRFAGSAKPGAPLLTGRGHAFFDGAGWVVGSSYRHGTMEASEQLADRQGNEGKLQAWTALLGWPQDIGTHQAHFAGLRANTPDRAPLLGALSSGFWVSTGHASSGLTTAFLGGEIIASALTGAPPVVDREMLQALNPGRF